MKLIVLFILVASSAFAANSGSVWKRHVIDDSSQGADGVRLADVNGDRLQDIVTGWEEGGIVRVYLNPGYSKAKMNWPAVTVGKATSVEDAVFVDLDADGAVDVVSSGEGKTRSMFVHWAPAAKSDYLKAEAWTSSPIPTTAGRMQWMFCLPLEIDGKNGIDLVAAGKGTKAELGWLEAPARARDLKDWNWHPLCKVGWMMSIQAQDLDGDHDLDILATDRRGETRGCFWLENPGVGSIGKLPWHRHEIGAGGREVMFMALSDFDRDGLLDCLVSAKQNETLFIRALKSGGQTWKSIAIPFPENTGRAKAVNVGDINLDGRPDLVLTCEGATPPLSGVFWMSYRGSPTNGIWERHEIAGPVGIKYDLVELIDLDGDGDFDALTCEERSNLGVIWYENPVR